MKPHARLESDLRPTVGPPTGPEPSAVLLAALTLAPRTLRSALLLTAIAATCAGPAPAHAQQAFFHGLGYLPGLNSFSRATDISGDGSIVVGTSSGNSILQQEPFRWSRGTGMVAFSNTNGNFVDGQISNDGSTIAWSNQIGDSDYHFFRWRESSGIVSLPTTFGFNLITYRMRLSGLSADGSKIALSGAVWTEDGGFVSSPNNMYIEDISGDGLSLLGSIPGQPGQGGRIWSEQEGVTVLSPTLPDGTNFYKPREISADGKVVVGFATRPNPIQYRLVRWKKETGMIDLGPAEFAWTYAISEDGSVFIVSSYGDSAIWRETRGLEPLVGVLANEFKLASQMAGWDAKSLLVSGMSNDGRTIVGQGTNPAGKTEAWIAFLGTPVPEPSAFILAALAMTPLTSRRRRASRARIMRTPGCPPDAS